MGMDIVVGHERRIMPMYKYMSILTFHSHVYRKPF